MWFNWFRLHKLCSGFDWAVWTELIAGITCSSKHSVNRQVKSCSDWSKSVRWLRLKSPLYCKMIIFLNYLLTHSFREHTTFFSIRKINTSVKACIWLLLVRILSLAWTADDKRQITGIHIKRFMSLSMAMQIIQWNVSIIFLVQSKMTLMSELG